MADAGVASRRECETMIEAGRVEVNGHAVTDLPAFAHPGKDRIVVDGRVIETGRHGPAKVYVMLNKPERTLAATRDAGSVEGNPRRTVLDLVDHPSGARLYPVGRLDYHATGLILLTNDGDLTQRLTHARYGVGQTYRVWVGGEVSGETLEMLRRRIGKRDETDAEGRPTGGVRVDVRPGDKRPSGDLAGATVLEITLREGRRESVADMLLASGCRVKKMARVGIGPIRLRNVAVGAWRNLFPEEVADLRDAAGMAQPGQGRERRTGKGHLIKDAPRGPRRTKQKAQSAARSGAEPGTRRGRGRG